MFGNSLENIQSVDVKSTEVETRDYCNEFEIPTIGDLKSKLECIFNLEGVQDKQSEVLIKIFGDEQNVKSVILDNDTVITLPESRDIKKNIEIQHNDEIDVSLKDVKLTRDLTEDEKTMLQKTLGWTDKQIGKCTIDEDGVIHYKTDREDMECKTSENGIPYERKTVDIHGIKVQGVFPVFESACDAQLPEYLEKASNVRQFKECNKQLKENIANNPEMCDLFTNEQLDEIEDGYTPTGYVWHHNEETGKMQLVKVEDHDRTQGGAAHTGGKILWGGGYSNHENSTTSESIATQYYDSSNKEVE